MKFAYLTCCVESTAALIDAMTENAREVTRQTVERRCDLSEWKRAHGYTGPGSLRLAADWHVRYFKSTFDGRPCFYIVHSAIEYVFCDPDARGAADSTSEEDESDDISDMDGTTGYRVQYECDCGCAWEGTWSSACDDECPQCGADVEASDYELDGTYSQRQLDRFNDPNRTAT